VTDALGHITMTAYDANDNVTSVTDATGAVTQFVYDAAGRQTAVIDALGHTTTTTYDAADRPIAVTDALGNKTQTQYDANGRVTASIDALGNKTTMVYDANGNLTSITDPDGNTTAFTYDALNRKTVTTDQLGHTTTTTYDAAGRVSSITDADGRVRVFAYDAADRRTGETWISTGNATVNQLSYTYDANGNLLTASDNSGTYTNVYDSQNRLISQTNPQGMTLAYQYDAAGRVIQRADSFGGVLNYVYDNADRLTSEQFGGTNQTQTRVDLAYDNRNELTVLTRYADIAASVLVGTTGYSYDAAGRVIAIANRTANTTLLSYYAYAYNNADRVTSETWQSTTATGTLSGIHNYSYDVSNQLTADGSTAFSYDANGNRTMTGYQTGANNHITNDGVFAYSYDAVGNIIQRTKGAGLETWYYSYDTLNRLTSIRKTSDGTTNVYTVAYTYDVLGNRTVEDVWQAGVGETITRTAFDGGQAWADLTSANVVTTRYVWGAGGQELYARIDVGAGLRQVSQDRLGSVRDIWDGAGVSLDHVEYAAYGAINSETAAALGGNYLYTGLWENRTTRSVETDNRTLFVDIGRWAQPDPITFSAGDANINRYVANNPTNLTDPSGLASIKPVKIPVPSTSYTEQLFFESSGLFGSKAYIGMSDPSCCSVRRSTYRGTYVVSKEQLDREVANDTYSDSKYWDDWFKDHGQQVGSPINNVPDNRVPKPNSTLGESMNQAIPGHRENAKWAVGAGTALATVAIIWTGLGPSFVTQSGETLLLKGGSWVSKSGAPATAADASAADQAVLATQKGIDPNRLHHIFGDPGHNFGPLVAQFRTEATAFQAMQQAAENVVAAKNITGLFEEVVTVGGQQITIRGNVVNGVVKIATAFK
jgi:RHS repeat-associated protein